MASPYHSDMFDDTAEEYRRIQARKEELREEAKTATPERRKEIGWWMFGANKHLGRLADANLARRLGEHRFIIHQVDDDGIWAVCSCGARFPGQMHEDLTLETFPVLDGHITREVTSNDPPEPESGPPRC